MRPAPAPDPERTGSYLICATPRTGSSLLCGLLDSTGVAGHPESWFRRQDEREFAAGWGIADPSEVTAHLALVESYRLHEARGPSACPPGRAWRLTGRS
ncbi:MAG TPA: Stf0 family sulfotransferase [Trebonia sp.]